MTGGFISCRDVCEYLGISKATLSRLVKNKEITSARFGNRVLFKTEWVNDFVVRCTTKAEGD